MLRKYFSLVVSENNMEMDAATHVVPCLEHHIGAVSNSIINRE